ncbi:hypothetical protein D9M72_503280 [compost metagenome]
MVRCDIEGRAEAGEHAEAGDGENGDDYTALEGGNVSRNDFKRLQVYVDNAVDLLLESLAVRAIGIGVALLVGGLRRDLLAKPRRLDAESLELRGAGDQRIEGRFRFSRDQRAPLGEQRVDLVEVLADAFGEGLGLLDGRGGVNTARFHDDRGHQTVQAFRVEGARRNILVLVEFLVVSADSDQRHPGHRNRQQAHDPDDQIDFTAYFHPDLHKVARPVRLSDTPPPHCTEATLK